MLWPLILHALACSNILAGRGAPVLELLLLHARAIAVVGVQAAEGLNAGLPRRQSHRVRRALRPLHPAAQRMHACQPWVTLQTSAASHLCSAACIADLRIPCTCVSTLLNQQDFFYMFCGLTSSQSHTLLLNILQGRWRGQGG